MAHVAHVAGVSERKVVVGAPLAGPVTNSLGRLLAWNLSWSDLLHSFSKSILVFGGLLHMRWHTIGVLVRLGLLAPVAFLAALEVVVLALRALPSTFWELEVSSLWRCWSNVLLSILGVGAARAGGVVLIHIIGHWSHLGDLSCGWLGSNKLLHVWEEGLLGGLHLGCLLWEAIVVIDGNVIDSWLWLSPDWVLSKDRSVLLWLSW